MRKRVAVLLLAQMFLAMPAFNANTKLSALQFLVGHWQGTAHGELGSGTVERDYEFVMKETFIRVRNKSMYPPQEKNPKGETHDDFGLFSYDGNRKKHVLRQFHVEGFVNQYVEDTFALKAFLCLFAEGKIGRTSCMRSHISVHSATT